MASWASLFGCSWDRWNAAVEADSPRDQMRLWHHWWFRRERGSSPGVSRRSSQLETSTKLVTARGSGPQSHTHTHTHIYTCQYWANGKDIGMPLADRGVLGDWLQRTQEFPAVEDASACWEGLWGGWHPGSAYRSHSAQDSFFWRKKYLTNNIYFWFKSFVYTWYFI